MRTVIATTLLAMLSSSVMAGGAQSALRNRCLAAIEASGQPATRKTLRETMAMPMGEHYLFQFTDHAGGEFSCQVCDDTNPASHCRTLGLELGYRSKGGEARRLPAELDQKCIYFLQQELSDPGSIDRALVKRVRVTPEHTDSRWLFHMELDGQDYRCVVRKSDGMFHVEGKNGDTWKLLANGVMF